MDTDYEDDFDFSAGGTSPAAPVTGLPASTSKARHFQAQSDSDPSTDEYSSLFDRAVAGNSDWSGAESMPSHYDQDPDKAISIQPPLHTRAAAEEGDFDEDEEKQSTLKAKAQELTEPSRNTLNNLTSMGDTIKGTVNLLGTKRQSPTTADEVDLSFDMDIPDDLEKRLDASLRPRASFESHISIEDDPPLPAAPRPKTGTSPRKPRDSASSLASQAESVNEDIEEGFDLPSNLQSLSLSSNSRKHSRFASSSSSTSSASTHNAFPDEAQDTRTRTISSTSGTSARSGEMSSTSALLRPSDGRTARSKPSMTTLFSPSSASHSAASGDEGDNDADFFDGIDASDFFQLQQPRASTSKTPHNDLQGILKAKLEARLRETEAATPTPPASPPNSASRRRRHHRESNDSFEDGLVVDERAFKRVPSRGGSLDSAALAKQHATPRHVSPRPGSASAILPGIGASAPIARRGLSHTKSFVRALSEAHSQSNPPDTRSGLSQSDQSRASSSRLQDANMPSAAAKQTLNRKTSTPLLSVKPGTSHTQNFPSTSSATLGAQDFSRQRTISLQRKASMPLLSADQPMTSSRLRKLTNEGRDTQLSPTGVPPTRPSTPAGAGSAVRLTLPTVSSIAKQRLKPTSRLSHEGEHPPRSASDPTGSTSSVLFPSRVDSRKISGASGVASSILRKPKRSRHYGDGTELDAFDDLPANKEKERRFHAIAKGRPDSATPHPRKPVNRRATHKPADKGKEKSKAQRAKPQLIRNLNPTHTSRIEGNMLWNPQTMKWEGNEGALRAFEHVLSSSARPALISPFPAPSPGQSKGRTSHGLTAGLGGVRVVGEMVFDPVRMSWFNLDDKGEDELDFGDDEAEMPTGYFSTSQDAVHLNAKASFNSSQDGRQSTSTQSAAEDGFNEACHEAEKRHRQELKSYPMTVQDRDDRSHLWKIRQIVMKGSL